MSVWDKQQKSTIKFSTKKKKKKVDKLDVLSQHPFVANELRVPLASTNNIVHLEKKK